MSMSYESTPPALQRLRSLRINCNTESNTLRIPRSARSRYSIRRHQPLGHDQRQSPSQSAQRTVHQTTPTEPRFAYNQSQINLTVHHHHHQMANHRTLAKNNVLNTNRISLSQQRRKRPKRRIRTFYSKKWGNRLYGMTSLGLAPRTDHPNDSPVQRTEHLSPFVEEEYLDLNDMLKTPPSHPNDSVTQHLSVDWRVDRERERQREESVTYYDSAVSNIAANTDIDQDTEYDEDHEDDEDDDDEGKVNAKSTFKIVVSAPNRPNGRDRNYIDEYDHDDDEEERRAFRARMRAKHRKRGYVGSDVESAASSDYSSCDDFDANSTEHEGEDEEDDDDDDDDDDVDDKSRFFLSGNDLKRGIYSTFNRDYSEDSDTDYLSAQSDDFSELSICYQQSKKNKKNMKRKKNINIKFRESRLNVCHKEEFLSDVGVSDIGSSDTDWGSSADSIPDSIPPPVHSEYLTVIHR